MKESLAAGPGSGVSPEPGLQEGEEAPQGPAVVHGWPWFGTHGSHKWRRGKSSRGSWTGEGTGPACVAGSSAAVGEGAMREQSSPASFPRPQGGNPGGTGWHGMTCPTATVAGPGGPPGSSASFCGGTMVVAILSLTPMSQ